MAARKSKRKPQMCFVRKKQRTFFLLLVCITFLILCICINYSTNSSSSNSDIIRVTLKKVNSLATELTLPLRVIRGKWLIHKFNKVHT